MGNSDIKNCYNCDKYIASVGEKGYCKLYRHETTLPEKPCPRFEAKAEKHHEENVVVKKSSDKDEKIKNILIIGSFFASTVITIIGMMFAFNLSMAVISIDTIPVLFKVLTTLISALLILVFSNILFFFGKRFLIARVSEMLIALAVVILILLNPNVVFETFSEYIVGYIELIISSI